VRIALSRCPTGASCVDRRGGRAHAWVVNDDDIRHQQANWFLGGILLLISSGIGIAISMARSERLFIVAGVAVGLVLCWAVNKLAT
jgi:hypothetical protein